MSPKWRCQNLLDCGRNDQKGEATLTWRQHKAKPGLFIVPCRVILTLKAPLHISPATLMEVQYDPKEDLNVEVGSNYFSFTALLFWAWQSICGGRGPECCVLTLSHPANICARHTNTLLTHCQYCVSVRQNIRLDKRLWRIIPTKAASGPGSIRATHNQ